MEAFKVERLTRSAICDTHGEFEESGTTMPFGNRRTIWHGCKGCNATREVREAEERRIEEERARQQRIEARLQTSGIPLRFRDRTFENFVADTPEKREALRVASQFAADFDEHARLGTQVIFSGKPGTGKSHLAIAAATQVMAGGTALYINAMDLVRMVRDTWRRDSERSEVQVLNLLGSVDLLVLDEIGVQYGTEGEQVVLFDVLNRRYRDLMPTILLTNLGKAGMKDFLGERSFDRLREGGIWVAFDWESHRGSKRAA